MPENSTWIYTDGENVDESISITGGPTTVWSKSIGTYEDSATKEHGLSNDAISAITATFVFGLPIITLYGKKLMEKLMYK